MSFHAGGTGSSWPNYQQQQQQQQQPGQMAQPGSWPDQRGQSKAVAISEQERLIELKKQEIQQKMAEKKQKREEETSKKAAAVGIKFNIGRSSPTATHSQPAPIEPPKPTAAPDNQAPTETKTAANIFSNDGSFMEQFRRMQEEKADQGTKPETSSKPDLSDIPLPSPPEQQPDSAPPPAPVQPIAFSPAASHSKKPTLPARKHSAFRDSDDDDDDALNANDPELLRTINILALEVAEEGLMVEETTKKERKGDALYRFLFDHDSPEHKYYQKRVVELRLAKKVRSIREMKKAAGNTSETQAPRKRKSRWIESGPSDAAVATIPPPKITIIAPGSVGKAGPRPLPGVAGVGGTGVASSELGDVADNDWGFGGGGGVSTAELGTTVNPVGMIGTTELSAAQLMQLKEQQEMQRMVDSMVKYHNKIASTGRNAASPAPKKNKYAYDSDEDTEGGTWEHKQRTHEMQETKERAEILTQMGKGRHHLGDFLPPEELEKFLETLEALKEGRTPDFSDYQKFKIQADNIGYQMLKKLGWEEGKGLGATEQGITTPVNKGSASTATTGLGIDKASNLTKDDAEDEFSAYRKRMMLAYRFRPNPLNNPRRPYY